MLQHGAGKQSFREFSRTANENRQYIIRALNSGHYYNIEQVEEWYEQILGEYENTLSDNEIPNSELWLSRAASLSEDIISNLLNRYPSINQTNTFGTNEDDNENKEQQQENEDNSIFSYPVVTEDECVDTHEGSVRGQVLLTLEELEEYLQPVPASVILGIVLVYDEFSQIVGFRLCGAKNT
jgi:hypothetical protein